VFFAIRLFKIGDLEYKSFSHKTFSHKFLQIFVANSMFLLVCLTWGAACIY